MDGPLEALYMRAVDQKPNISKSTGHRVSDNLRCTGKEGSKSAKSMGQNYSNYHYYH